MNTITYTYRGEVERGNGKPGYDWHAGYSETTPEGHALAPWMTYRECLADAKARGCKAVCIIPVPPARAAATPESDGDK